MDEGEAVAQELTRTRQARVTESTYLVQRQATPTGATWVDVRTVTVPARSHRSSVLLEQLSKLEDVNAGDRFRLLDERSATVMGLKEKERRDPQFEVVIDP